MVLGSYCVLNSMTIMGGGWAGGQDAPGKERSCNEKRSKPANKLVIWKGDSSKYGNNSTICLFICSFIHSFMMTKYLYIQW